MTSLPRSDVDFEALFDAAPGIYLVLDADFNMVAANEARLKATMTRREDIIGKYLFDVFPDNPDDPAADGVRNLRISLERVLQTKTADAMAVQKYDIQRPDERGGGFETRYWSPLNTPVLGSGGEVKYIIHRVEDVTDFMRLKQEEERLQSHADRIEHEIYQRAQEVQEANRRFETANAELVRLYEKTKELDATKTRFFANISHELRTPLTLILGPVDRMLRAPGIDDKQRQSLEMMARNARLLLHHVNDLLDVAKLDAGKTDVRYVEADLAALMRLMAGHFESLASDRHIAFTVEAPVSVLAETDAEKVQRILLNLLSNAFKFTPDGGRIACTLRLDGDRAEIGIEDSGPGVPEAMRTLIFEPFRQGEEEATRRFGGTGLGLAIAKEFLDLLGGEIKVSEASTGGARFSLWFPLAAPAGVEIAEGAWDAALDSDLRYALDVETARAPRLAAQPSPRSDKRALALVIEDNPEMNQFIAEALSSVCDVAHALDGKQGLSKAEELRPDIILTDMMMPGMSGEQVVATLRARTDFNDTPVILLTAKADEAMRVSLLRSGVQDVVTKPFNADELLARVRNLLAAEHERRGLQEQLQQSQKLEAMGQLTGGVAHDFNNLLTVVVATTERMSAAVRDHPHLLAMVEAIDRAADRGTQLTSRLLAFARKQTLRRTVIDLNDVVAGMSEVLMRTLGAGVRIDLKLDPSLWSSFADRAQVEDALLNLCVNARDAMPAGGRLLIETQNRRVEGDPELEPGDYTVLSVTDTGIGMPPEIIARAVEPFFTTKEAGQGTGLGLSMIYGFAKQSGGRLSIRSTVGRGTSIELYLRRSNARPTDEAPHVEQPPPRGAGELVLLVEDDAEVRVAATALLEELGYSVCVAPDARTALSILRERPSIDLLFSDVVLPNAMSGPQLWVEARRMHPHLKVLFASGYAAEPLQDQTLETSLLVAKPYRKQTLGHALRAALGR